MSTPGASPALDYTHLPPLVKISDIQRRLIALVQGDAYFQAVSSGMSILTYDPGGIDPNNAQSDVTFVLAPALFSDPDVSLGPPGASTSEKQISLSLMIYFAMPGQRSAALWLYRSDVTDYVREAFRHYPTDTTGDGAQLWQSMELRNPYLPGTACTSYIDNAAGSCASVTGIIVKGAMKTTPPTSGTPIITT